MTENSRADRVEIFAQAVVSGKTQSDAYRLAYPSAVKWKDNVVHVKACEMAKHGSVVVRVKGLRQEMAKNSSWTREESVKGFREIFYGSDSKIKYSDRVSAGKVLNDMTGYNSPTKIDHLSSDGSMSSRPCIDTSKMSDKSIKEFLEAKDAAEKK